MLPLAPGQASVPPGTLTPLLVLLPQTFIDMEGSGFGGDLESLRVSGDECLSCQLVMGGTLSAMAPCLF